MPSDKIMRVAFQMDPMEGVNIAEDTSFALALEAQRRGAALFEYGPQHLAYDGGRVIAHARPMVLRDQIGDHVTFEDRRVIDLADDVDVVWMRQDPPFDMSYITACHLLEMLKGRTLVANDPTWVRSCPEKIVPLDYAHLMPPTMIARNKGMIDAFRAEHGTVIVKPLYGNGGAGIFKLSPDDSNYSSLLEMFFESSREPVMVQAFIPEVSAGDKRILIVDGQLAGGFNRVPLKGETRSNMHVGGQAQPVALTETDVAIAKELGPMLRDRGQILVGIDVIAGRLTEINLTSPTGVHELKRFTGVDTTALCWDAIERRLEG
ncbi:MAG: glutathione synthase [Pseudomonadota bacterium]